MGFSNSCKVGAERMTRQGQEIVIKEQREYRTVPRKNSPAKKGRPRIRQRTRLLSHCTSTSIRVLFSVLLAGI